MENGIKEQQIDLFADRTSAHLMRANQLRAYFSAFAGVLIRIIRQFGLKATGMEQTQAGTIRTRLLKIAGAVRVTTRKDLGLALLALPLAPTLPPWSSKTSRPPPGSYAQRRRNAPRTRFPLCPDSFTTGVQCRLQPRGWPTLRQYITPNTNR